LGSDGGTTNDFSASWNGTTISSQTNIPTTNGAYTPYSFTEVAAGSTTTILFSFRNDPGYLALDDVSVVANGSTVIPEPSSMALACIGGLSLVVVTAWRRRYGARPTVR
jgi:hypothetical protein